MQGRHVETGRLRVEQRNSLGQILKGAKSKRRAYRVVPLPAVLAEELAAWVEEKDIGADAPLFPSRQGTYWTEHQYRNWRRRVYHPAALALGLPTNPYALRHTYISLRFAAGATPIEVAAAAGHSPSMSLDVYGSVIEGLEGKTLNIDQAIREARRKVARAAAQQQKRGGRPRAE